jgi:single stranded DNA-binding protein (ssb)
MANDVQIAFVGTLGGDPEIRYGADGKARCRIRIAANPSRFDKQAGQWVEQGVTQWYSATAFEAEAETWAEALHKGQRVRIEGLLVVREWQTQTGETRLDQEIRNPRVTLPLPKNTPQASQDRFSGPQSGHAGNYASAGYSASQSRIGDPAGNLAQMDFPSDPPF